MKKLNNQRGMTLMEVILVVAIIGILGGVSAVGVYNYQRAFGQLERDGVAKEIFVAAQNHLTAAFGAGYYGTTDVGEPGTAEEDGGKSIYYYAVNGTIPENSVLGQMLPFGSIDETVRGGGSYIIRYQQDTGLVLDVFYCSRSGTPERYNHSLNASEYEEVLALRDTKTANHKMDRRNWKEGSILGWYGGAEAIELPTVTLLPPTISVKNEEKLYVEISDPNSNQPYADLKLIVTGADSKAQKSYVLKLAPDDTSRVKPYLDPGTGLMRYTVILDDVTAAGMHFADITADSGEFIPGEDLVIQAVSYSTTALANIAYSSKNSANSLFGSISSDKTTAYIGNIRHLENLDAAISKLDQNDTGGKLNIHAAEQTDSFSWTGFQKGVKRIETKSVSGVASETGFGDVSVKDKNGTSAGTGYYMPIAPNYELTYDGRHHSISDVKTSWSNAGLFGSVADSKVSAIRNLELIDFHITGKASAGALAGSLTGCAVTNVLARSSEASSAADVTASIAGGLIGKMDGGKVWYSAAAVVVTGNDTIGGLIGTFVNADGSSETKEIKGCFSGGHTDRGEYYAHDSDGARGDAMYTVRGAAATTGGLIGNAGTTTILDSYSTCAVFGKRAGGFAGSAIGSISNCYATGLVDGTVKYAFVAGGNPSLSGNRYYMAINEIPKEDGKEGETEPMPPVSGYAFNSMYLAKVKPLDLNADVFNEFSGAFDTWNVARAYDSALVKYYDGKYPLRTVDELNDELPSGYLNWNELYVVAHYGDWPSPEVFFINT